MKRGFSLVEVIIAITILSVVLIALLHIKENNIYLLQRVEQSSIKDAQIALAAIFEDSNSSQKEGKTYMDDLFDFKDDTIRKQFKDIVVETRVEEEDHKEFEFEPIRIDQYISQKNYKLKDGSNKTLYNFRLDISW